MKTMATKAKAPAFRIRFVYDDDARFEESNGEARPLTEDEYKGNEYMGCPVHPRKPLKGNGHCSSPDCRRKAQPIPYAEYLAYYGNPERHVYLGCIVDKQCPCCAEWQQATSVWNIDCMDDSPELAAVHISDSRKSFYTPAEALALPGYLADVAREQLEEAGYKAKGGK